MKISGEKRTAEHRLDEVCWQSTKYYYYPTDQVNSTRVVTGETGQVVYSAAHDPYGGVQQTWVNTFNPGWKFSGHEQDPASLYYFGARYYDPALYRFLSPDPVIPADRALYNPQRWNLYGYCLGNPINFVDPFGDITIRIWRTLYNNYATYGVYEIELGDTRIWGFTMEPAVGKGKGPIPAGVYEADWFYSKNNDQLRIKLDDVWNFKDVEIHIGNSPKDTTGCILVGKDVDTKGNLGGSTKSMNELMEKIFNYQLGALREFIHDGSFDLELMSWLLSIRVIIYDIPKGTVTVEVSFSML